MLIQLQKDVKSVALELGVQTHRKVKDFKYGTLKSAAEMIRDGLDANEKLFLKTNIVD